MSPTSGVKGRFGVRVPAAISLMAIAASMTGCEDPKAAVEGLLAMCDEASVDLTRWWSDVPAEDTATIQIDPVGGWIFLYWIDGDGVVCHGEPGVSGWPGPLALTVYDVRARMVDTIPASMLPSLQQIDFSLGSYNAPGPHLAQFGNAMWRARDNGVRIDGPPYNFAVAAVVEPERGAFCLQPWANFAPGRTPCIYGGIFLPRVDTPDGQHPDACHQRAVPGSGVLSTEERRLICVPHLPQGTAAHGI